MNEYQWLIDILFMTSYVAAVIWWPPTFKALYQEKNGYAHSVVANLAHIVGLICEIVACALLGLIGSTILLVGHLIASTVFTGMVLAYRRARDAKAGGVAEGDRGADLAGG